MHLLPLDLVCNSFISHLTFTYKIWTEGNHQPHLQAIIGPNRYVSISETIQEKNKKKNSV